MAVSGLLRQPYRDRTAKINRRAAYRTQVADATAAAHIVSSVGFG
jgi:hypothetical protein